MSDWTESQRQILRGGLALLAITPAIIGVWGLAAPRSFFDTFPGAGHHWVSALPPYNEHLLRDYASANLGFLVLLGFAAVVLERRLVQGALVAYAAAGIPHLAYHLTTTSSYATGDNVVSLVSLALLVVAPLYLLWLTLPRTVGRRRPEPAIAARGEGT
jgi:hypothetical protein